MITITAKPKGDFKIGEKKAIVVDKYQRTSDKDIFAVGDCAEKTDFFTQKQTNIMLASTATTEARIAGANLFKLKVLFSKSFISNNLNCLLNILSQSLTFILNSSNGL